MAERSYKEITGGNLWLPKEKGESKEGKVTEVNENGLYGLSVTISDRDAKEILLPSHKMLQNLLRKAQIKVGVFIKVEYTGNVEGKKQDYESYKLFVSN